MARIMCVAAASIMASMLVQADQCSYGNERPSDEEPKGVMSVLQRDFQMNVPKVLGQDMNRERVTDVHPDCTQWMNGCTQPALPGHPTWGLVHCPKTAGSSFREFMRSILPEGDGLVASEICHAEMVATAARRYVTFFREPRAHVYSQYLECTEDGWGKEILKTNTANGISNDIFGDVSTWLAHFSADKNTTFDGGCYNPVNMQSRTLECSSNLHHHLSGEDWPLPIDVLRQRMEGYAFVGIVERYQESACLFVLLVSGSLPPYCDCEDHAMWKTFPGIHETHEVPSHHVDDLSKLDLKRIDDLTERDAKLWQGAVKRFISDIDKAEHKTGTRILCDRQISSL